MESEKDKAALVKWMRSMLKFCTSDKESMRRLRIAGPIWRHVATGKESAYEEVVKKMQQLANELGIDAAELK